MKTIEKTKVFLTIFNLFFAKKREKYVNRYGIYQVFQNHISEMLRQIGETLVSRFCIGM